jgi:IS1 family transposase
VNKLAPEERALILHLLCEGSSIRAVTRLTGASKNTVAKLLLVAGKACAEYQDRTLRNLTCKHIQVDEIWCFVYSKQANVPASKRGEAGDIWTWTAIDADTKLLVSWLVGSRDINAALQLMDDLRSRLANRVQLTTDGLKVYLQAVDTVFGEDVDYAQLVKLYGSEAVAEKRYSPAAFLSARKTPISGDPDPKHVSTSYAERHNLTMRMQMRRFTRLTNGFSKKAENHAAAVALHSIFYNFVRVHQTLKTTPAVAAGVVERPWQVADIVAVIEAWELGNDRRQPKLEVHGWKIGGGFFVLVTWPNGGTTEIPGFTTEADAAKWIRNEWPVWHYERRQEQRRGKHAARHN